MSPAPDRPARAANRPRPSPLRRRNDRHSRDCAAWRTARSLLIDGGFVEIFVDAPLPVCEARDPKGLYARARRGEIPQFSGIDSSYEPPERPEMRLDTVALTADEAAEQVLRFLDDRERSPGRRRARPLSRSYLAAALDGTAADGPHSP